MRLVILAAAALVATIAAPALAQDAIPTAPPEAPDIDGGDRVTIGLGVAILPDYEGADESSVTPGAVAVGTIGGFDFFTRGTQLYVDVLRDAPGPGTKLEFGPIAAFRLERTGDLDDARVAALGEFDTAYEVGAFVGISRTGVITSDFDTLSARVGFVHDVSGVYDSYVITPQVNYSTPLSYSTLVSIGASADYVGKGYGRAYFSVSPLGSAASGLRVYDAAESGFNRVNLSFFAIQSLTGDLRRGLGVGAGVLYGRLLGRYKDSPLVQDVGSADQWAGAIGLTYTF